MKADQISAILLTLLLAAGASACGSSAKPSVQSPVQPSVHPTTTAPSSSTTTVTRRPAGANVVVVSEADKGRTVPVAAGDRVQVVLHSTYWNIGEVSDAAVLRPTGAPVVAAKLAGCVPGGGCGTVTANYDAVASGVAVVPASRTSCGEAMGCSGAAGAYSVTIKVA